MTRLQLIVALLLVVITATAGAGAFRLWRQQDRAAEARAALPAVPNLIRWPAEMVAHVQEATTAVRRSPDFIAPLGRLASLYLINGFAPEAGRTLAALRRLQPDNARWPYLLAELHLRGGDKAQAEQALEAVVSLDSDYAPAWLRLGDLLAERQVLDRADRCYREAALVAPGSVRAAFAVISFEAWHGQRTDPRRSLTELARLHPGIKELHTLLAQLHAAAGEPARARQEQRLAARADRSLGTEDPWVDELFDRCYDPNRLGLLANRLGREKRVAEAERLLRRAMQFSPADPTPRQALATLFEAADRIADARVVLETALTECPGEPDLRVALSRMLCLEHKPLEAAAVVRTALQRWPERGELHGALGFALRSARENEEAVVALEEALRLDPTLVEARYDLGFCRLALKQRGAARDAVEQALAMRPDYPEALVLLGSLALENGEIETAQRHILALFELEPDEPGSRLLFSALHLVTGNAAQEAGQLDEADRLYRAGLEVSPEFATLLRETARLQARRAEYGQVAELLERYLRLEPRDLDAYAPLAEAYHEIRRPEQQERALERGWEMAGKLGNDARRAEFEALLDKL